MKTCIQDNHWGARIQNRINETRKLREGKLLLGTLNKVTGKKILVEDFQKSKRMVKPIINAKLSKLLMAKSYGSCICCMRLWNQFETEIVKINLHSVSKCFVLQKNLKPKVYLLVEGLIFSLRDYTQANKRSKVEI